MSVRLAASLLAMVCFSSYAEVLQDIRYGTTLNKLKAQYPNAIYKVEKPAWLQPNEAFITVSGAGMSGQMKVAFNDSRPYWAAYTREDAIKLFNGISAGDIDEKVEGLLSYAKQLSTSVDGEALTVDWVRWVPPAPIPLTKVSGRYGKPRCMVNDIFENVCEWKSRALIATLDDSGKQVISLESTYTDLEKRQGLGLE